MRVVIGWNEIALRLALTVAAGLIIGFNRGEHGRPAGMRTTLLVCLAASLSMLQANLLMNSTGKERDSFVVLDLMRLPLGVLSGMGFIGAGTILRKGNLVLGVTTAATLWFVTMMGLCFGGGQLGLGLAALVLGCATLWALKRVEALMHPQVRGSLIITFNTNEFEDELLRDQITRSGAVVISWGISQMRQPPRTEITCDLEWKTGQNNRVPPPVVKQLRDNPDIQTLKWQPQGSSDSATCQQAKPSGTPVPISAPD